MGANPQAVVMPQDIWLIGMFFAGGGACAVLVLSAILFWIMRALLKRSRRGERPLDEWYS